MNLWYLEGDLNEDGRNIQQHLHPLPVILGRDKNLGCTIPSPVISRQHAIFEEGKLDALLLKDLGSSNGTFVNRHKITEPTIVRHGDIIHLGTIEMRLIDRSHYAQHPPEQTGCGNTMLISLSEQSLSENIPFGVNELEEMIDNRLINIDFQPVVQSHNKKVCGYEIQGRGFSPKLSPNPTELFRIAESVGLEVDLSIIMRDMGIEIANRNKLQGMLLIKIHSTELEDCDRLLSSMTDLRKRYPKALLMLEISEQAMTDLEQLSEFNCGLDKLGIRYAFNDFGVGQSRLIELVNARPHLVKFDRALIENIHEADSSRLSILMQLHDMVKELRIKTLGASINTLEEYQGCKPIGFDMYQGNYFGIAAPVELLNRDLS